VSVEIQNILEEEDREVFMTLSQTYLEWKEGVRRQAREELLKKVVKLEKKLLKKVVKQVFKQVFKRRVGG